MQIHYQCGGTVFSHDLFSLANGKEKYASMINGHDYLLRKCGFLAQQLHFYDLNLEPDASSCKQSCRQTSETSCVLGPPLYVGQPDHGALKSGTLDPFGLSFSFVPFSTCAIIHLPLV
ncbi:hypothetical protein PAMP_010955 [Pampus punctatissimus]